MSNFIIDATSGYHDLGLVKVKLLNSKTFKDFPLLEQASRRWKVYKQEQELLFMRSKNVCQAIENEKNMFS